MANDCLVTKLKKTVNNSDLMKLGIITIKAEAISPFNANNNIKLRYKDESGRAVTDGMFVNSQDVPIGTSIDVNANADTYLVLNENQCSIDIHNKYAVKELDCGQRFYIKLDMLNYCDELSKLSGQLIGNLSQLSGFTSLEYINCWSNGALEGDIQTLENLTSLTTISIRGMRGIFGNISSLGKLTSLEELKFGDTQISGRVEDFVAAQRLNGRTTCSGIDVPYLGLSNITFNGTAAPSAASQTLSWTASEITIA